MFGLPTIRSLHVGLQDLKHVDCLLYLQALFSLYLTNLLEQYVEENERLRAILGEWSTRAAKVFSSILCWQLPKIIIS